MQHPLFSLSVMISSENSLNYYLFHGRTHQTHKLSLSLSRSLCLSLLASHGALLGACLHHRCFSSTSIGFHQAPVRDPKLETNEKVVVIGRDHDSGVKSDFQNWETEEVVRIVGKIDEFRVKIRNSEKIDENEIELVDLEENPVEETSHGWGCAADESNQGVKINEVKVELMECESRSHKVEEVDISQCDRICNEIDEYKRNGEVSEYMGLLDEDDWERIERTELERCFGAAVVFVGSKSNANLSNDVKMKLYGYHRIATQGPCREPQPMALKFSARAKRNAWQQLGIMSPELAMERYISLLSESIPDWMANYPYENVDSASADIRAFAS